MNSPFTSLDFERFTYRQGQLLASRDFRDQQRMEEARRWMHNTAMHNAWGVAVGYDFSLPEGNEERDEEESPGKIWREGQKLTLQPGIAYDCFGRELILPAAVTFSREDLPNPKGQRLFLVASYQEPARVSRWRAASSVAFPPPLLRWKPEREVHYELEVPILFVTIATVANDAGDSVQRYSVERYAASQLHPQARPRIASGQTVPGLTAWRLWEIDSFRVALGLQVDINTGDAGFQQTPCYFAWLNGPLVVILDEEESPLAPFVSLANEKPDGFTFRVLLSPQPRVEPADANRNKLTICWLGIEAGAAGLQSAPPPPPGDVITLL